MASSKERYWDTLNPHLSSALGTSVPFWVAFWCLALQDWGEPETSPGRFLLSSSGNMVSSLAVVFCHFSAHLDLCLLCSLPEFLDTQSPSQNVDSRRLIKSISKPDISKLVFPSIPITKRVSSCHVPHYLLLPKKDKQSPGTAGLLVHSVLIFASYCRRSHPLGADRSHRHKII